MSVQEAILAKIDNIMQISEKLGFYSEISDNKVKIFSGEDELFEYQADTNRFIRRGRKEFITLLNTFTYGAYIKRCLATESKKISRQEKTANKERFTSCQYGNKAYAVYDNDTAKMVTHLRSEGLAKKKVEELKTINID